MRVIRILVGASLTLVLGAAALLARLIPAPAARLRWLTAVRRAWARSLLSLLNVRVTVDPAAAACSGPALYVANHTGYLDILVLMSVTPAASQTFVCTGTGIMAWQGLWPNATQGQRQKHR